MAGKEEDKQQLQAEAQMLISRIQQIQQEFEVLEQQFMHAQKAIADISNLSKEDRPKAFVPVSRGVFTEAKLVDTDKFFVNVGSGVIAEKTSNDVKKLLQEQSEELRKGQHQLAANMKQLATRVREIEQNLK